MPDTLPKAPRETAEWLCTKCGSTNRQYLLLGTPAAEDRCVSCRTKHVIWPGTRPVRWNSEAK